MKKVRKFLLSMTVMLFVLTASVFSMRLTSSAAQTPETPTSKPAAATTGKKVIPLVHCLYYHGESVDGSNVPASWFSSLPTNSLAWGTKLEDITNRNVIVIFGRLDSPCTHNYIRTVIDAVKIHKLPVNIVYYDVDMPAAELSRRTWDWGISSYTGGTSQGNKLLSYTTIDQSEARYPIVAYVHDGLVWDVTVDGISNSGAIDTAVCNLTMCDWIPPVKQEQAKPTGSSTGNTKANETPATTTTTVASTASSKAVNPNVLVPGQRYTVNSVDEYKAYVAKALKNADTSLLLSTAVSAIKDHAIDYVNEVVDVDQPSLGDGYFSTGARIALVGSSMDVDLTFGYEVDHSHMVDIKAATDEKAAKIIAEIIKPGMKDYEKELAIHDYIINHTDYDSAAASYNEAHKAEMEKGIIPIDVASSYMSYGVLCLGKGVCEGYSYAACKLLNMVGIKTKVVPGTAGKPHMWDMVLLDGKYYHLDLTFDDPVTSDGTKMLEHKYFNLRDSDLKAQGRVWDSALPKCEDNTYAYDKISSLMGSVITNNSNDKTNSSKAVDPLSAGTNAQSAAAGSSCEIAPAPSTNATAPADAKKTRFEMEKGVLQGGTSVYGFAAASNGKIVTSNSNLGASITFKNAPKAIGLNIGYAVGASNALMDRKYGPIQFGLYVNDIKIQDVMFPTTGGSGKETKDYKEVYVAADIPEGVTIKLQRDNVSNRAFANLDYIDLVTK